jgi:hypothetical protein
LKTTNRAARHSVLQRRIGLEGETVFRI